MTPAQTRAILGELRSVVRSSIALTVQKRLAEQDVCCPNCDWAMGIYTRTGEVIGWECAQTGRREMIV